MQAQARKVPNHEQKPPKLAQKQRVGGKDRHLGNTTHGNYKTLCSILLCHQCRRHRNKHIKTNKGTSQEAIREASQQRRGRSARRHWRRQKLRKRSCGPPPCTTSTGVWWMLSLVYGTDGNQSVEIPQAHKKYRIECTRNTRFTRVIKP